MGKIKKGLLFFLLPVPALVIIGAFMHGVENEEPGAFFFAGLLIAVPVILLLRNKRKNRDKQKKKDTDSGAASWAATASMTKRVSRDSFLRCQWCGKPVPAGADHCSACGGAVRNLEPGVLYCGWCGTSNRRDKQAVCSACGGPLPSIPGKRPGARPEDPLRRLPSGYRYRVLWKTNVMARVTGLISVIFLVLSLILPLLEAPLLFYLPVLGNFILASLFMTISILWKARWIRPLRFGVPTRGVLSAVREFSRPENPFLLLDFEYETPQGTFSCTVESHDPGSRERQPGEHFWVVYLKDKPERNAVWPPLY